MEKGIHASLNISAEVSVYLDNGSFGLLGTEDTVSRHEREILRKEYEEFVGKGKPDWCPIPQDFIPTPQMTPDRQRRCFLRTMRVNRDYSHDGYVPVVHVGQFLTRYLTAMQRHGTLSLKQSIAIGGIVPNLLRAPKAMPYVDILAGLKRVRDTFVDRKIHIFGVGGTATLHLAILLGMDSADSSGWRNRAARGLVQLPGTGDRMVADLGSWRGRALTKDELEALRACPCPACAQFGLDGLKARGMDGFCNRATHNLWVLLTEARDIESHLSDGSYALWHERHLDNSTYLPLIRLALDQHVSPLP